LKAVENVKKSINSYNAQIAKFKTKKAFFEKKALTSQDESKVFEYE